MQYKKKLIIVFNNIFWNDCVLVMIVSYTYLKKVKEFNMFTIYVLHSEKFDKIYIGFTSDLEARLILYNNYPLKVY